MEWQSNNYFKQIDQEAAQEFLQTYLESLQDHKKFHNMLHEHCKLNYFGESFYGQEEVCYQIMGKLYGSDFELDSLTTGKEVFVDCSPLCDIQGVHIVENIQKVQLSQSYF